MYCGQERRDQNGDEGDDNQQFLIQHRDDDRSSRKHFVNTKSGSTVCGGEDRKPTPPLLRAVSRSAGLATVSR